MSTSGRKTDLAALLNTLHESEFGPERLLLAERGITEAARQGDELAGFDFREDLMLSCALLGQLDRAIPAMEWCLARCDGAPDRFDVRRVLFQYKWIIEELPRHSSFDATTIERGLQDLERRFDAAGWSRRGALELRMLVSWSMRRIDEAARHFAAWQALPPDEGSDCPACATAHRVRHFINSREPQQAVDAAAPLLSGEQSCMDEPARCFSRLQFAFADLDRLDEAIELHVRSIETSLAGAQFSQARANHLLFLVLTGNLEPAGRLLEIGLPQAVDGTSDLDLLHTCSAGELVLRVLHNQGMETPDLERRPELDIHSAPQWLPWMSEQADRLAAIFDQRNGNTAESEMVQESRRLADALGSLEG